MGGTVQLMLENIIYLPFYSYSFVQYTYLNDEIYNFKTGEIYNFQIFFKNIFHRIIL